MSFYSYVPLEGPRDFRLLKIHHLKTTRQDIDAQDWKLELVHAPLDTAPAYETISYVWGGSDKSRLVRFANGKTLAITETLHQLLPYVFRASETGHLWFDQLCINQSDTAERNQQVAMMADIYSEAQRTIVWLGEEDGSTRIITEIAHSLGSCNLQFALRARNPQTQNSQWREEKIMGYLKSRCANRCVVHGTPVDRSTADNTNVSWLDADCGLLEGLEAAFEVFKRPWFSRCWIVQEALLSKEVFMMIGDAKFAPCDLYSTAVSISSIAIPDIDRKKIVSILQEGSGWHPFNWMMMYHDKVEHGHWHMFSMLLSTLRSYAIGGFPSMSEEKRPSFVAVREHMGVSDKRDVIYSHLGLHPRGRHLIKPDYSLSTQQVFIDATRAFIEETRDLAVLGLCDKFYGVHGVEDLPSWVPDWSTRVHMMPLTSLKSKFNGLDFDYSFTASGDYKHQVQPRNLSPRLLVRGIQMDAISAIHPRQFEHLDTNSPKRQSDPLDLESMVEDMSVPPWDVEDVSLGRVLNVMSLDRHGTARQMHSNYRSRPGGYEGYLDTILYHSRWRRLCRGVFDNYSLGMVPVPSNTGDEIWVLDGCPVPVVLRRKNAGEYELVGACYFEGLMHCEDDMWVEMESQAIHLV